MSECAWPTCRDEARDKMKYCFMHGRVYEGTLTSTPAKTEKPKPIAPKSKKMVETDKAYNKFKKEFLSKPENQSCAIKSPVCTGKATCINHKKRRHKNTKMNSNFVEPSCSSCNTFIEQNDAWARERGHLLSIHN